MVAGSSGKHGFDRQEPIAGYKTTELLGRGGYGEVWKTIAPGGIPKAVKIIYGDADPTQAETELRALARIKDVRHPLLLSIERIEMCEGNLVIVTELADGSLKDRFSQLRQAQSVGIPQVELLRYVSDTAEALDYLYESYSLQHLDVKPENILLLSGRAKLGDFGLVKNLYERSASMVGGLTPTYSSPELFEGKPNRHSDQYGLALVYTHMLTGVLPFPGGSTAQIAASHLHGVPDLSALPRAQRPVIARALSKDPALRFGTCMDLVAALRDAIRAEESGGDRPAAAVSGQSTPNSAPSPSAIPRFPQSNTPQVRTATSTDTINTKAPPVAGATVGKQQSVATHSQSGSDPTILIGVGGLGVEVLTRLVNRLNDRFGPASQWPPVEIIVLDSHTRSLSSRFREEDLDRVHVVPIPIKPADSYGSQTAAVLKWLGRRWFYNIPRDLTTNGYRPLGRLALVTNGPRVRTALANVISKAARLGAANGRTPRVTLIGGVGGGTGSGAIPDLTYAIRSELKRQELPHERLQGVLLHATPRSHAERDKSRSNAYALLRELHHYSAPGSHYPGEPLLGALPFHGDNAAFGETLMFQLGEGLGQTEWELAAEQMAEFLYASNFTAADNLLRAPASSGSEVTQAVPLHAHRAQVTALGAGGSTTIAEATRVASDDVIRFWREGRSSPAPHTTSVNVKTLKLASLQPSANSAATAATLAAMRQQFELCQLNVQHIRNDATEVIRLESGASVEDFVTNLVDQALGVTKENEQGTIRAGIVLDLLDRCLQSDFHEGLDNLGDDQLFMQVVGRLTARTRPRINKLFTWVQEIIDSADQRLDGARRSALAIQHELQTLCDDAIKQAVGQMDSAHEIGELARSDAFHRPERRGLVAWVCRQTPDDKLREILRSYANIRLNEFLLRVTAKIVRIVDAELTTLIEQLDRLSRDLARLSNLTPAPIQSDSSTEADLPDSTTIVLAYRNMLREQLELRRYEISQQIDAQTTRQLVSQGRELRKLLDPAVDLQPVLWQPLLQTSRQTVLECVQDINRKLLAVCRTGSQSGSMNKVVELLRERLVTSDDENTQIFAQCLVIPAGTDASALSGLSPQTTVVEVPLTDLTLCTIENAVPLSQLATEVTGGVAMYKELGSRLQTRVDIEWRDLDEAAPMTWSQSAEDLSSDDILPTTPLKL
ncbi:MAG: serine/threonine protein kinase [Planctomycetaceae bacterium]|nr:serine/threonine protein kinase [Planctomycetaceae bacterium]